MVEEGRSAFSHGALVQTNHELHPSTRESGAGPRATRLNAERRVPSADCLLLFLLPEQPDDVVYRILRLLLLLLLGLTLLSLIRLRLLLLLLLTSQSTQ